MNRYFVPYYPLGENLLNAAIFTSTVPLVIHPYKTWIGLSLLLKPAVFYR